jgi:hypothetical protein
MAVVDDKKNGRRSAPTAPFLSALQTKPSYTERFDSRFMRTGMMIKMVHGTLATTRTTSTKTMKNQRSNPMSLHVARVDL